MYVGLICVTSAVRLVAVYKIFVDCWIYARYLIFSDRVSRFVVMTFHQLDLLVPLYVRHDVSEI